MLHLQGQGDFFPSLVVRTITQDPRIMRLLLSEAETIRISRVIQALYKLDADDPEPRQSPEKRATNSSEDDRSSFVIQIVRQWENKQKRTFAIKHLFGVASTVNIGGGSMPPRSQARKCVQQWSSRSLSSLNTRLIGKRSFGAQIYDGSDCHRESVRSPNPGCVFLSRRVNKKRKKVEEAINCFQ